MVATLTDKDGRAVYMFDCLLALFPERRMEIIKGQLSLEAVHQSLQQFRNNRKRFTHVPSFPRK